MCLSLCTTVVHNTACNISDYFPSQPADNHHNSDDVYWRRGGTVAVTQVTAWCCRVGFKKSKIEVTVMQSSVNEVSISCRMSLDGDARTSDVGHTSSVLFVVVVVVVVGSSSSSSCSTGLRRTAAAACDGRALTPLDHRLPPGRSSAPSPTGRGQSPSVAVSLLARYRDD